MTFTVWVGPSWITTEIKESTNIFKKNDGRRGPSYLSTHIYAHWVTIHHADDGRHPCTRRARAPRASGPGARASSRSTGVLAADNLVKRRAAGGVCVASTSAVSLLYLAAGVAGFAGHGISPTKLKLKLASTLSSSTLELSTDTTTHVVGVVLHRGVALEDAPTEEHVAVLGRAVQTGRVQPAEHHLHAVVGLVQRVAIAREGEGESAVGTLGTTS